MNDAKTHIFRTRAQFAFLLFALGAPCGISHAETVVTYLDCLLRGKVNVAPIRGDPSEGEDILKQARVSLIVKESPIDLTFTVTGNPDYNFQIGVNKQHGESTPSQFEKANEVNNSTAEKFDIAGEYTPRSNQTHRQSLTLDRISGELYAEIVEQDLRTRRIYFGKCQKAISQKPQF